MPECAYPRLYFKKISSAPLPISKRAGFRDFQPGHRGALRPGEGMSYVAGGYAGTQSARRVGEGHIDFLEVVGSSGHGGCGGGDVATRKVTCFNLSAGYVYEK